jgi:ribosome maturation factor RimP
MTQSAGTNNKETIEAKISEWLSPLGYELVALEVSTSGNRMLRVYIDRIGNDPTRGAAVGIEDCVKVTKAISEPLDQIPEAEKLFGGNAYELEVSSPGVDRPLRKSEDFNRFSGRLARIHVFRPLSADELRNTEYQTKNPKQKNFVGTLVSVEGNDVILSIQAAREPSRVSIPIGLISKANLEPVFDFSDKKEMKA